jgi:hypothetical protein
VRSSYLTVDHSDSDTTVLGDSDSSDAGVVCHMSDNVDASWMMNSVDENTIPGSQVSGT